MIQMYTLEPGLQMIQMYTLEPGLHTRARVTATVAVKAMVKADGYGKGWWLW